MATINPINNTLPTPFNVGATSVTSTGTQLNLLNAMTVVPFNKINIQVFTASGTYTPTAGMKYCQIECVGGGGGSGGATSNFVNTYASSGGGGSGSYSRKIATAADIGVSKTVTIGAGGIGGADGTTAGSDGGDTSVGSLCIAKGGSGSKKSQDGGDGGLGGVAGTGDFTPTGMSGTNGFYNMVAISTPVPAGNGGSSIYGGGGLGAVANTAGNNGSAYGAGGGGCGSFNQVGQAGAAGSDGVVVITEFLSA